MSTQIIITFVGSIISGIIVAVICYYLINIKFTPILLDKPRIRINHFHCSSRSKEGARLYANFNYSITNEGKNPATKVFIYLCKKKLYDLGFIEALSRKRDSFNKWLDIDDEKLIQNGGGDKSVSFIYKDIHRNWFISEYKYPISSDSSQNISYAKRLHLWDWLVKLREYEDIQSIKSAV